jgi:hypothetical protein
VESKGYFERFNRARVLAEIDVFQLKLNADQNGQLTGVGFDIKKKKKKKRFHCKRL